MREETKLTLRKFDENGAYEFPSNFNYKELEKKAKIVDASLRAHGMKTIFEGALCNQDASFSIAVILEDYKTIDNGFILSPAIRFSNFGFMATLTSIDVLPNQAIVFVVNSLEAAGFIYIPCKEIDEAYDGVMKNADIFSSWWIRYFDWL